MALSLWPPVLLLALPLLALPLLVVLLVLLLLLLTLLLLVELALLVAPLVEVRLSAPLPLLELSSMRVLAATGLLLLLLVLLLLPLLGTILVRGVLDAACAWVAELEACAAVGFER